MSPRWNGTPVKHYKGSLCMVEKCMEWIEKRKKITAVI